MVDSLQDEVVLSLPAGSAVQSVVAEYLSERSTARAPSRPSRTERRMRARTRLCWPAARDERVPPR